MKTIKTIGVVAGLLLAANAASAASVQDVMNMLPENLQAEYKNSSSTVVIPAFDKFSVPSKPWKWCHSESYQGNPWRVALTNELKRLVEGLVADGTLSSFEMSDSNGDASIQISHIRSFIEKKCDVITSVPGSATGLNAAIDAAAAAGIPFVTAASAVTSKAAFNVDSNYYKWGYDMAKKLSKSLDSKGNVIMVEGIAGYSITDQEREGALAGFAEFPNVKVVRMVNGDWTPSVTKSVVLQTLATNPAPIHGVWTAGSETRVVAEAFAQAGRPLPVTTGSITGDALGYWKENPGTFKFTGNALLPAWIGQTLFRVTSRIMAGQKPVLNTMMIPIPPVEMADFNNWYSACMKPNSAEIFPVSPTDPVPSEVMKAYFGSGATAAGWDFSKVPAACS